MAVQQFRHSRFITIGCVREADVVAPFVIVIVEVQIAITEVALQTAREAGLANCLNYGVFVIPCVHSKPR